VPVTSLTVVCLPAGTPADQLPAAAANRVAGTPLTMLGFAGHFIARHRLRRRGLLPVVRRVTAGGPISRLDFDAMRTAARDAYWMRWNIWNQVIACSRPAQPFWTFLERHHATPRSYSLDKAQRAYLAQPRIAAMRIYNALPGRVTDLPTRHLEAFQTGAHSYAHYGWLAAVAGDGMLFPDGTRLDGTDGQLAARLSYLNLANARLSALGGRDRCVALWTH
jgi:hypothetical protein